MMNSAAADGALGTNHFYSFLNNGVMLNTMDFIPKMVIFVLKMMDFRARFLGEREDQMVLGHDYETQCSSPLGILRYHRPPLGPLAGIWRQVGALVGRFFLVSASRYQDQIQAKIGDKRWISWKNDFTLTGSLPSRCPRSRRCCYTEHLHVSIENHHFSTANQILLWKNHE